MGRGYIVEDAVERYLSKLCEQQAGPVTGLLIGQSSAQRDFVIMATQTPQREESAAATGNSLDKEWVTEHARQVSRMLPGGLSVLGIFIITDADGKDTLTTVRQLVFAVENLISSEQLWNPADDDITDCVTLHVNPKTRKTVCRTFDVKDPKSMAKPADWKYQSGVCSSWTMVSCCLNVDMLVPLPNNRASTENMDACLKEGLKVWADQIKSGVCLIDGKKLPEDTELTAGQKRNVRQTYTTQLLITPDDQRLTDVIQRCGGSVSVRGTIHSRAYLHSNKPKAKLAEKLLKRDVVSTVATRVQMLLEELLTSEEESKSSTDKQQTEQFCLPRRVFCPVEAAGPVCVCDYQFSDEGLSEVTDRLKEMLDIDAAEEDLDTRQEMTAEITESNITAEPGVESVEVLEPKRKNYTGVAIATAVALLGAAASMLYLNDV
ncbi:protein odr-4 homolog [Xiphias gladius]|uniref:protein odr-4 homolog n=1 Tax=Xiphias gladius TaxID=8245 RepID=UPI001A99C69B|nr:protein odr-4 homolog [Xiphias gladius]XP_040000167.1 protein odr-4 homolog [Xiphias gladius]XP_040000168.1 protein odr-4 homolog [Xiphias gladius]XP_040000169.1 protein odr-4 homolog [Xiphias gladius]XP_040000170.1 protein odr-4 homolog [Xiphias gladius]